MKTMAVVLEQPEHLVLSQLDLTDPGRRRRGRRHRVERHQHRHREAAVDRPHARLPRHGLPAGAGLRIGGPRRRGRRRRPGTASANASSCPAPAASARCAACSAAPPRAWWCRGKRVVPVNEIAGRTAPCCWRWPPPPTTRSPAAASATPIVPPDLIVGHGVLGRLLARMTVVAGCTATDGVGDQPAARAAAPRATPVHPPRRGPAARLPRHLRRQRRLRRSSTRLIGRLAPGGEIVLAGFYSEPLSFAFAPAFMREAQIRVAAEWQRPDLLAVKELAESGAPVARRPDHPPRRSRRTPTPPTAPPSATRPV